MNALPARGDACQGMDQALPALLAQLPFDLQTIVEETAYLLMTADDPLAATHEFVRLFEGFLAQHGVASDVLASRGGEGQ